MIKKRDPIKCNLPNVCFSLMRKRDKRWHEMKKQRMSRGFDDSETWSLDSTIINFLYPRLKRYYELADGFIVIDNDMRKAIDDMLWFCERYKQDEDNCDHYLTKEELARIPEIFEQFGKHFMRLWW